MENTLKQFEYVKSCKYTDLELVYSECSGSGGLQLTEFMAEKMGLHFGSRACARRLELVESVHSLRSSLQSGSAWRSQNYSAGWRTLAVLWVRDCAKTQLKKCPLGE